MRQSYAELAAAVAALRLDNERLMSALHLVHNFKRDAKETLRETDGGRYIFELYGAQRAQGGLVVLTYYYKHQSPCTSVHWLEDLRASLPIHAVEHRNAVDRLMIARNRIVEGRAP